LALSQAEIRDRFDRNVERVRNLVSIYEKLAGRGQGRRPVQSTDILRAATVLLHASLEDYLRATAERLLPLSAPESLAEVPLVGTKFSRQPKFTLADLARHRQKSVTQLIQESVSESLELSTYNNTGEISRLLERVGVAAAKVSSSFADLDSLMKRRHNIVHRADANPDRGRGQHAALGINKGDLEHWLWAIPDFIDRLEQELAA